MNHLLDNIFSLNGILALVANLGAFAVMWLQGSKVRVAWLLAIVIQLLWAWFYCRTGALLMLFVIAAKQGLNIRALVKWGSNSITRKNYERRPKSRSARATNGT